MHSATGTFVAEIGVGDSPWSLAKAPNRNEIWVVNKKDATITVINATTFVQLTTIDLPLGSMPHGLAFAQNSNFAYVALEGTGEVMRIDAASRLIDATATVGGAVRHVSVTGDGSKVFVSKFITPPLPNEHTASPVVSDASGVYGGEVVELSGSLAAVRTVVLQHSNRAASEHSGPGIPNYLGPAVIAPDGVTAWVASKQDNILAGGLRGGVGITFDQTVRAVSSMFDVATGLEDLSMRIDHDNASIAKDVVYGKYGAYLFTVLEGNREIAVSDTFDGNELFRFNVGRAPQAIAISSDGYTIAVHNFMDRTIGIYDVTEVVERHQTVVTEVAVRPTVGVEALSAAVLLGKQHFYDARDDRLALDSYMACASCHNDGGQDGRVWDFTSLGEGLRNTIELNGRGGMAHGILHWSGNFDEVQDFENQIRDFAGGFGLMSDTDFNATQALLGAPKAGLSTDLDALAAYVASLSTVAPSPYRPVAGLSASAESGRTLFIQQGCNTCHAGLIATDSPTGARHDVGTISAASGSRIGATLDGFDTPTLLDLWATAPYLHDGSAPTVEAAISAHTGVTLSAAQLTQVADFLYEIQPADLVVPSSVQTGSETTDERIRTVNLAGFTNPAIIMGPPSRNGGDPSTMRVQNVNASSFQQFLDEWAYLDGPHTNETVGYLAIEQGTTAFGTLQAEVSEVSITDGWSTVTFSTPFAVAPVVLAQVATVNEADPVTHRIRNVTATGFQIRLQEEEASNGSHAAETVHWVAIEPGTTTVDGAPALVGRTGNDRRHTYSTINFGGTYTNPVFLAAMQTFDGGDTAAMRMRNLSTTSVQVSVEEERSANNEVNHTTEVVGYVVIGR